MSTEKKSLMGTLQDLIKASEYDQQDLAKIAGVTAGTLSKYLNEKSEMPVFVFAAIIKALGVSADALLLGDEVEAEKKKKEPGVPEVLDALQVLLETFEPVLELVPYTAKETFFDPSLATDTVIESNGYEFFSSAFFEEETKCLSININSTVIQELLHSWQTCKELIAERPFQAALFTERIFEEDVKQAKERYDAIDNKSGGFYRMEDPIVFVRQSEDAIPYELSNANLHISPEVFRVRFASSEDYIDEYGRNIKGEEYAIPNDNRILIQECGYSLESLDKALDAKDLSMLEPLNYEDVEKKIMAASRLTQEKLRGETKDE